MAPIPQNPFLYPDGAHNAERVVISGMSGLYPECRNVKDLSDVLYNKVNPVLSGKHDWGEHVEVSPFVGKIPELDRFDAQFFKVHRLLGVNMDPMARKLLEQVYQAIYDAGVNPDSLSGRNIGVYLGVGFAESERVKVFNLKSLNGFIIPGCSRSMHANRISYWLNVTGPSMVFDTACSSSITALQKAYLAIKNGDCEAAIVGGCNLCLHQVSTINYGRMMTLNKDGETRSFDENASGLSRSEAINILFLQKHKDALRIYGEVSHVKAEFTASISTDSKCGYQRDPKHLANFLQQFYNETNISPRDIEYVEGFGAAEQKADKAELEAIEEVFCRHDRKDVVLVGSVTSNIGHTDTASGMAAITKVLLGYEKGLIAANLNCRNPRQDISALRDGRMRIVTEHTPFRRSYAAINSISFSGVNGHVVLQRHYKPKDHDRYKTNIPYLVTASGRQEASVRKIVDSLKSQKIDPEEIALLHNIHEEKITNHMARGFAIIDRNEKDETQCMKEEIRYYDDVNRPLWFVYSGMGSQWPGMGKQLMRIPTFAAAIERCHKVLQPRGLDIVDIISSPDKTTFDNILHSFVGIAAVQIGLTDVLQELKIFPDNIIGHSVGELGCAYADGCLSAEEMILSAYSRGLVSLETPFIRGSMAAVGLGYKKIRTMCPPEIEVACHNGPDSCTISGPAEAMKEFVDKLTAQGMFAKEVPCSNIAYHSRYIAEAGPKLLQYLSDVIQDPKPRSERWVSTSIPKERWSEENAKYCSAWYHTNNLLCPVLFEETSKLIPDEAVVIEIAPHGLLQAILQRSLPSGCRNIPLTKRGHPDNTVFLLEAIGKIYLEGFNPKLEALYPKVEFPVSTGTPMLSHLIEWNHTEEWAIPSVEHWGKNSSFCCNFIISVHDEEYSYLDGNVIRGKKQYPFAAALVAVWDTLAMASGVPKKSLSVQFSNIDLYAQSLILDQRCLRIQVVIHRGTGFFEVTMETSKIISGIIQAVASDEKSIAQNSKVSADMDFDADILYILLKEKGYAYKDDFRSIYKSNRTFTNSLLLWTSNWVTLIDGMIQLNILRNNHDSLSQPRHIKRIAIDVKAHSNVTIESVDNRPVVLAETFELFNYTRCGGVVLDKIEFLDLPSIVPSQYKLKALQFVPHFNYYIDDDNSIVDLFLQIVAENVNKDIIKVIDTTADYLKTFENYELCDERSKVNCEIIKRDSIIQRKDVLQTDVIILRNISIDENMVKALCRILLPGTFIINEEENNKDTVLSPDLYKVVNKHSTKNFKLELARWKPSECQENICSFIVETETDINRITVLDHLRQNHKLEIITRYPLLPEVKNFIKKWRSHIVLTMISGNADLKQIKSSKPNLAVRILKNGVWGGEYYVNWKKSIGVERGMVLQSGKIGDLDSIKWFEATEVAETGISVMIRYVSISDYDAKRALGLTSAKMEDYGYGMEYSGSTVNGVRVMGVVRGGAASGRVVAVPELTWPVPAHWTLEDAATVPLAYVQALYCLGVKSKLYKNMKVLVHGGAGALGQAAISIALAHQCEVFTTVSTLQKKHFLLKMFPTLKKCNIGNSRDETFRDMILQNTNGQGCDIIISCVKGRLKDDTLKCGAYCGVTFDVVQAHTDDDYSYGMFHLTKQRSYVVVNLQTIFERPEEMRLVQVMMSEGIARGWVRPLSRVTYAAQEAPRAFRLLAAGRQRGRVLLRLRESILPAQARLSCSRNSTHVIVCDGNVFGLQLANRLVERGVDRLRLHVPIPTHSMQKQAIIWRNLGVKVEFVSEDLTTDEGISKLLKDQHMIEGIYVVATDIPEDKLNIFVLKLHASVASNNSALRHIAIISGESSKEDQLSMSWENESFPITTVHLNKVLSSVEESSLGSILDAVESALRSAEHKFLVTPEKHAPKTLLQQLCSLAELVIPEDISKYVTLNDLKLDESKHKAIQLHLLNVYNLWINDSEIPNLTVDKLRKIEELVTEPHFPEVHGLGTWFSNVDSNELTATKDIVLLPTLSNKITNVDEVILDEKCLYIIPGLEGLHSRFGTLCERLKLTAAVLQPGLSNSNESQTEITQKYINILQKKTRINNNYYILGYESGIITALEIASYLEDKGIIGTVFCLGYTPKELKDCLDNQFSSLTDQALQDAVILHMRKLIVGDVPAELELSLKNVSSWEDKLDVAVNSLVGRISYSKEYARLLMRSAYERVAGVRRHACAGARALRSRVVLLRAAGGPAPPRADLQLHSQRPVLEHALRLPLAHVTQDTLCATIINQHLHQSIRDEYESKNVCETYTTDFNLF